LPVAVVEQVLGLYRDQYFDLNVRHFHEKLHAEHGIELSYTWVKLALQGAGLVTRGRKRGVHRKRRARRPLPGMLLHIDGSHHRWFQDERWYDLIVILDDASSEIYYAQLVERVDNTRSRSEHVHGPAYSQRTTHGDQGNSPSSPVGRRGLAGNCVSAFTKRKLERYKIGAPKRLRQAENVGSVAHDCRRCRSEDGPPKRVAGIRNHSAAYSGRER
jgi:hypothetical protein